MAKCKDPFSLLATIETRITRESETVIEFRPILVVPDANAEDSGIREILNWEERNTNYVKEKSERWLGLFPIIREIECKEYLSH